ncbi:MAG: DUF4954 family protein, partial [Muribaculaceae bacterium]|nr:DUF4954 family protein [Muribaculaceae bacterium]
DAEGYIGYKGLKIKKHSLEKGRKLYELALSKYIHSIRDKDSTAGSENPTALSERWVDLSGQVIAESNFKEVLKADSIVKMEEAFDKAAEDYDINERIWLADIIKDRIDMDENTSALKASELDALLEKDRNTSIQQIARENDMLTFL